MKILVDEYFLNQQRGEWLEQNDPQDGTDCVTPFDRYLYGQAAQHPDDAAVDAFAVAMKAKLARSREKGRHGWQTCSAQRLSAMLYEHLYKADPVDVANFSMMLHQNGQYIELPQEARREPATADTRLVELLGRAQVCLSLDDTEWALSDKEKLSLRDDIKAALDTTKESRHE